MLSSSKALNAAHRVVLALSLLITALPSTAFGTSIFSAFAASTSHKPTKLLRHPLSVPSLLTRGGQQSARNMSNVDNDNVNKDTTTTVTRKTYPLAPVATDSPFAVPVKKVTIAGGTHGNEYTGVWCIKAIEKQRENYKDEREATNGASNVGNNPINIFRKYPSLEIDTLLANPMAYMENKRFIDTDLNREFSMEKLKRVNVNDETMELCDIQHEFCSEDDDNLASLPHEAIRAREIETKLGPKFIASSSPNGDAAYPDPRMDIVIDLHTTTANMGISLIIPEGDALMSAAAAYVLNKCKNEYGYDSVQCCMHALPKRQDRMNLSSCGRHGFTIEVGPTPQGVIRHDVVEQTEAALHSLLEFLHLRNLELEQDNANAKSVLDRLREIYPGGIVPCFRSAPAVRPGELSGKISWPNDPENPNFPAVMVHKSIQDRDFEPLRIGDPLFVSLDGHIIPYDGSHGEEVHLIFVNEGGY
jgi:succinylglutamate desuccinylase